MRGDARGGVLRAAAVRSGRGSLGGAWLAAHRAVARTVFAWLRPPPGSALYAQGSFGEGEPVPGLSDLDLFVVVPDDDAPGERHRTLRARWKRAARRLPWLARHVDVRFAEQSELAAAVASAPSIAPAADPPPVPLVAPAGPDEAWLRTRPGPFEPTSTWRLLAGPERRPPVRADVPREAIAWLELSSLWRHAFALVKDPAGAYAPHMAAKLVADAARAWLWLVHRERHSARPAALRRALEVAPAEERWLRRAIDADARLGRRDPPDLTAALGGLARFSELMADRMAALAAGAGSVTVALVGEDDGDPAGPRPLADWKGIVLPGCLDDRVVAVPGDPGDPGSVAAALRAHPRGPWPALQAGSIAVLPALEPPGSRVSFARFRPVMRSLKCAATDPVPLALFDGRAEAAFPELPGFSARHTAGRAVAEHRAWRTHEEQGVDGLLSAARAGLFAASVEEGRPELLLDAESVLARLELEPGDRAGIAAAADGLLARAQ